MKIRWLISHALSVASLLAVSCSTVSNVSNTMKNGSVALLEKTSRATSSTLSGIKTLASETLNPADVKVVEVREKDLKKLPSGQERALAFESKRQRRSWFFGGPVDFIQPTLPPPSGEADGSLLPPISP